MVITALANHVALPQGSTASAAPNDNVVRALQAENQNLTAQLQQLQASLAELKQENRRLKDACVRARLETDTAKDDCLRERQQQQRMVAENNDRSYQLAAKDEELSALRAAHEQQMRDMRTQLAEARERAMQQQTQHHELYDSLQQQLAVQEATLQVKDRTISELERTIDAIKVLPLFVRVLSLVSVKRLLTVLFVGPIPADARPIVAVYKAVLRASVVQSATAAA